MHKLFRARMAEGSLQMKIEQTPPAVVDAAVSLLGTVALKLKLSVVLHMRHVIPKEFAKLEPRIIEAGWESVDKNPGELLALLWSYEWLLGPGRPPKPGHANQEDESALLPDNLKNTH